MVSMNRMAEDSLRRAVFLDRDGVINRTVFRRGAQRAPQDMGEWAWMEGVHETVATLRERGYLLVVCTNQPDVSRGWQTRAQVDAFHALIETELRVDRVYACFHDREHACDCRKPKPGMLLAARDAFGIEMAQSFMIGDRTGDIDAGRAAGCTTVHMRHPYDADAQPDADHEIRRLLDLLTIVPA